MAEFKLLISGKEGKTVQKEVKDVQADTFLGLKIGDKVKAGITILIKYENNNE